MYRGGSWDFYPREPVGVPLRVVAGKRTFNVGFRVAEPESGR